MTCLRANAAWKPPCAVCGTNGNQRTRGLLRRRKDPALRPPAVLEPKNTSGRFDPQCHVSVSLRVSRPVSRQGNTFSRR